MAGDYNVKLTAYNAAGVPKSTVKIVTIKAITFQKQLISFVNETGSIGTDVIVTNDGGYAIIGTSNTNRMELRKIDSKGNIISFPSSVLGGNSSGRSLAQTLSGDILAVGDITTTNDKDVLLAKFGTTIDTKTFGGAKLDEALSIEKTSDNGFIVCGTTFNVASNSNNIYLIKVNSIGDTIWTKKIDALGSSGVKAVQTSDGGFMVFGRSSTSTPILIKIDASGNPSIPVPITTNLYLTSMAFGKDGTFTFCTAKNAIDITLLNTNSSGTINWEKKIKSTSPTLPGLPPHVAVCKDGGYITCGGSPIQGAIYLIKNKANGDAEWDRTINVNSAIANSVLQTPDGGFIIVGSYSVNNGVSSQTMVLKTDQNGNL
jgi:hypothetical protein